MYRYSHRLSWSSSPNKLSGLAARKRSEGRPLLDLTVSNPTALAAYPHAQITAAFRSLDEFSYRPDAFGSKPARAAVAHYYRQQGIEIEDSRIALTASTSEAYALLFKLLCDAGDEILIPTPSYPLFEYLAGLESVRTVAYRLAYDGGWFIDFADLEKRITSRSRAILIVNPNNPTGSFLKNWEWQELAALASEKRLPVISDEVFMNFGFGERIGRVRTLTSSDEGVLSFSLNGLSKAVGMPQMKLAWIVLNGPADERRVARERLESILDTYLSVSTPVQLALPALLEIGSGIRAGIQARTAGNLAQAEAILDGSPGHVLHTEGGWSAVIQIPRTRGEEEWATGLLEEHSVLLQPGFFFDMPEEAYVVASLLSEPLEFDTGIRRMRDFIQD